VVKTTTPTVTANVTAAAAAGRGAIMPWRSSSKKGAAGERSAFYEPKPAMA
jgi:hypothetical protein